MDDVPQLGDALPLTASDPAWLAVALADLDAVHADHLHCERKAAQSALSLIRSYPDRADLVERMARLAHDETRHVVQVAALMALQGVDGVWIEREPDGQRVVVIHYTPSARPTHLPQQVNGLPTRIVGGEPIRAQ